MSDELLTFHSAKWIWYCKEAGKDTYADFFSSFEWNGEGRVLLKISSDSNYAAYINGTLAAFGQYADYPSYKVGDEVDITAFARKGKNLFAAIVWYYGVDSSTYLTGPAGLIYETECEGEILDCSGENTLSREDSGYRQGRCELITTQMGLSFYRDEGKADDSFIEGYLENFTPAVLTEGADVIYRRPVRSLCLKERCGSGIVQSGDFKYPADTYSAAEKMQHAVLGAAGTLNCGEDPESGKYYIFDLGKETVGFLELELYVPEACRIDIGWGEHLSDGRCRTAIRNFSVGFDAKAGKNRYMNPFRRFGARYLQLFVHSERAEIAYAGIRPTEYPLKVRDFGSPNELRNRIYETCVRTLRSCMHEHYEDCPWREQALYTMDSRNQMLCGYYAFEEYEFARASLRLIGEGLQDYGLLSICYPCNGNLCIPSFSCMYFLQMEEYIRYSGDLSLAEELYPRLERLIRTFTDRIDDTGLIPEFRGDQKYWNFYEWSGTLDGEDRGPGTKYHMVLNADVSLALNSFSKICRALRHEKRAEELERTRSRLNEAIREYFYDPSRGCFLTMKGEDRIAVLTNAAGLLCGAAEGCEITKILSIVSANGIGEDGSETAIPCTLSMNGFRYDALLQYDRERFAPVVLAEIDKVYSYMLNSGATTFWETIKGERDFDGAGSLCHGWSALPIYYYEILI